MLLERAKHLLRQLPDRLGRIRANGLFFLADDLVHPIEGRPRDIAVEIGVLPVLALIALASVIVERRLRP